MPLPLTNFSQFSRPLRHPHRNRWACFALLEDVLPSVAVSNDSISVSSLSEMSAGELLGDCLNSDSQLRASLARLDSGSDAKKLRMSAIARRSNFPHVCAEKAWHIYACVAWWSAEKNNGQQF